MMHSFTLGFPIFIPFGGNYSFVSVESFIFRSIVRRPLHKKSYTLISAGLDFAPKPCYSACML